MNLNSKNIGLVLSGGGAKGIAHAGALQFLEEKNIKPSVISGTSAGAIIASLYAFGKKPSEILTFFKSIYFFHWSHFTLKKAGIVDSESFKEYFDKVFGETKIRDLDIPIIITATDIVKGKLKIFKPETKLSDAVLASSAFPGIISPYKINNNLYSDGGILNHFPTDLIQGMCDNVIGVYVSPLQDITEKDLTSIKAVTTRAFDLLSAHSNYQKFSLCDLVIQPKELSKYSTFETNKTKMDAIFKIGYEEAKKALKDFEV